MNEKIIINYISKWNDKVLVDEFNIIYNKDESKINEIKKDYFTKIRSKRNSRTKK